MGKRILMTLLCAAFCPVFFWIGYTPPILTADTVFTDTTGDVFLECYSDNTLVVLQYDDTGALLNQWETPRIEDFNLLYLDDVLTVDGRVYGALSQINRIDNSVKRLQWVTLPFNGYDYESVGELVFEEHCTEPASHTLSWQDGALHSVVNLGDRLWICDVSAGKTVEAATGGHYPSTAALMPDGRILLADVLGVLYTQVPGETPILRCDPGYAGAFRTVTVMDGTVTCLDTKDGVFWEVADTTAEAWTLVPSEARLHPLDASAFPLPKLVDTVWLGLLVGTSLLATVVSWILSGPRCKVMIPLLWRLTAIVVAVLLLTVKYAYVLLSDTLETQQVSALKTAALRSALQLSYRIDNEQLAGIDWYHPEESAYFNTLMGIVPYHLRSYNLRVLQQDGVVIEPETMNHFTQLLTVRDGEAYTAILDLNYVNLPMSYFDTPDMLAEYRRLALGENQDPVFSGQQDRGLEWLTITLPILDEGGQVIALVQTGISKWQFVIESQQRAARMSAYLTVAMFVVAAILMVALAISLASLARLKRAVEAVGQGDFDQSVPVRGRDEIAAISSAFNSMSAHIDEQTRQLQVINQSYERFLPRGLLNIIHKESVLTVGRGDYGRVDTHILCIHFTDFDAVTRAMPDDAEFAYVNRLFASVLEVVLNRGGAVASYSQSEFVCLFETADSAYQAALELGHTLRKTTPCPGISQTLVACGALLGVVGHERRLGTLLLSDGLDLSRKLGAIAARYGVGLMCTQEIAFGRPLFRRRLGGLLFGDKEFVLFDCYEGEEYETYLRRREYTPQFEEAVALFEAGRFVESKQAWIRYLHLAAPDTAATGYLFLCEHNITNPQSQRGLGD